MIKELPSPGVIASTDWERVQRCFNMIKANIASGAWDHRQIYDQRLESMVFSLGDGGVAVKGMIEQGDSWHGWSGPWLEHILWWAKPIRQLFKDAGLPINTITYHNHSKSIDTHLDFNSQVTKQDNNLQVNINYMVDSSNPDVDYTYAIADQGYITRYYHHPGHLWLINAGVPHGVVCSGNRSALIIKLHSPYQDVEKFLDLHPNLFNESQSYLKDQIRAS